MPSSPKPQKGDPLDQTKQTSLPKYDYTYDATSKEKDAQPVDNTLQGWADKLKKMFK